MSPLVIVPIHVFNQNVRTTLLLNAFQTIVVAAKVDTFLKEKKLQISAVNKKLFPNSLLPLLSGCPFNMTIIPCRKNCLPSCHDLEPKGCHEPNICTPGCGCPNDYVFDNKTELCVSTSNCGMS